MDQSEDRMRKALSNFVDTIDATGGVMPDPEGSGGHVPAID